MTRSSPAPLLTRAVRLLLEVASEDAPSTPVAYSRRLVLYVLLVGVAGARIFAVADALDAMTQDRPYRRRCSLHEARDEVVRNRGTQFDPDVVEALLSVPEEELLSICAIRARVGVDLLTPQTPRAEPPPRVLTPRLDTTERSAGMRSRVA